MQQNKNKSHSFAAYALLFLLLFPAGLQLAHTLGEHQHKTCTDYSTHIHELENDCSLCDFHFTPFTFELLPNFEVVSIKNNKVPTVTYTSIVGNYTYHSYFLRGPPHVS